VRAGCLCDALLDMASWIVALPDAGTVGGGSFGLHTITEAAGFQAPSNHAQWTQFDAL
jgi:hypothetical protein